MQVGTKRAKSVRNVYVHIFQLSFHFAHRCWWLGAREAWGGGGGEEEMEKEANGISVRDLSSRESNKVALALKQYSRTPIYEVRAKSLL